MKKILLTISFIFLTVSVFGITDPVKKEIIIITNTNDEISEIRNGYFEFSVYRRNIEMTINDTTCPTESDDYKTVRVDFFTKDGTIGSSFLNLYCFNENGHQIYYSSACMANNDLIDFLTTKNGYVLLTIYCGEDKVMLIELKASKLY